MRRYFVLQREVLRHGSWLRRDYDRLSQLLRLFPVVTVQSSTSGPWARFEQIEIIAARLSIPISENEVVSSSLEAGSFSMDLDQVNVILWFSSLKERAK